MKNKRILLVLTMLLAVSMACASLFPKSADNGVMAGNINQKFVLPPPYDPKAPLPSPGAAALRALEVSVPGVAGLESDVEAAERAAFKSALAGLRTKLGADKTSEVPAPPAQSGGVKLTMSALKFSVPASSNPVDYLAAPIDTTPTVSLINGLLNGWNDMFQPEIKAGPGVSGSFPETKGGATTTHSLNLGRDADGSTHFGFGTKTESTKNNVSARTELAGNLDGKRCPDANGQVAFTVKMRIGMESGGSGYTQDLTANVRAVVDDAARASSYTVDVTQGTRQVKPGHQVYVETGETVKFDGANFSQSNLRLIRNSQDATPADVSDLSASGHTAAERMGVTAFKIAEQNWLDGGCTRIEAKSPGTVEPGSTTAIPVTVTQRFDGSVLSTKLEAALAGEKLLDPTSLAKTPGTINYTAPQEKGKTATITLTATSRRGRATLQLNANTGGQAYHVTGESNHVSFSGNICINKEFEIKATFPGGGSANTFFTPRADTNGKTTVTGGGGECYQEGGGAYTITTNKDGSKLLKWNTTDTLTCPEETKTQSGSFELPLIPDPQTSCP